MEPLTSATAPRLAWRWILEKLVDLPDFGVAYINVNAEVINTHVTDIEEPHCRPLLERVALRNLEEMVVANQFDFHAIALLKALTGPELGLVTIGSSVNQRFNKDLILRVQTEVALSALRKDVDEKEKGWACFELELDRVFGEAEGDNRLLDRKRELSALLKPKNQTTANVAAYFEKYSLIKLRNDLHSFIDENRESFKTMFLEQLSSYFLDANGTPFPQELGDGEKSMKVDANAKQDDVGTSNVESLEEFPGFNKDMNEEVEQNPKIDETVSLYGTGDQHTVLGTSTVSGKKRLRRKLLPMHDDIGDDDLKEIQESSVGIKKSRKVFPVSVVDPSKALLHQGLSERTISRFGPQSGSFPVKHEIELVKQISSLKRGEEAVSARRNIGSKVMRSCSPPVHTSMSRVPPREPGRSSKYVIVSDVESDAETQVVKLFSSDEDLIENRDNNDHQKEVDQYVIENGSDRRHSEKVAATEVMRKETIIVQSEMKEVVDERKEATTTLPEAKMSQLGDNEKFTTENGSIPQDVQDIYEVHFLKVGNDGHEDVCHICGLHGKLLCCDGCPISMHFKCIKHLGLRLPSREENWYCPICMSLKAAREAAEAEKAAAAAKEKLKAFQESIKRRSSSEGNLLHHPKQGKTVKQSGLRVNSLQPDELDMGWKLQHQSDEEPKLTGSEGGQVSEATKASLSPTILRGAVHQLKKLVEQDPENKGEDLLLEDQSQSKRVTSFGQGGGSKVSNDARRALRVNELLVNASSKSLLKNGAGSIRDASIKSVSDVEDVGEPYKIHPYRDQEISRTNQEISRTNFASSTSGLVKEEREPFTHFSKKIGPEFESAVPVVGGGGEVGDDRDDEDLDEDRAHKFEDLNWSPFLSGRQKIIGFRRRRLPWTREEEHVLKEGVKRFSNNGSWGFQWKRILEFGQGKFDPSRTDVDLKDKWRNLVKGVS